MKVVLRRTLDGPQADHKARQRPYRVNRRQNRAYTLVRDDTNKSPKGKRQVHYP